MGNIKKDIGMASTNSSSDLNYGRNYAPGELDQHFSKHEGENPLLPSRERTSVKGSKGVRNRRDPLLPTHLLPKKGAMVQVLLLLQIGSKQTNENVSGGALVEQG